MVFVVVSKKLKVVFGSILFVVVCATTLVQKRKHDAVKTGIRSPFDKASVVEVFLSSLIFFGY
jgi:hypothetical protein